MPSSFFKIAMEGDILRDRQTNRHIGYYTESALGLISEKIAINTVQCETSMIFRTTYENICVDIFYTYKYI